MQQISRQKNGKKKQRVPRIRVGERLKDSFSSERNGLHSELLPMLSPFWGWRMTARS